jgi:hypothetical protein
LPPRGDEEWTPRGPAPIANGLAFAKARHFTVIWSLILAKIPSPIPFTFLTSSIVL